MHYYWGARIIRLGAPRAQSTTPRAWVSLVCALANYLRARPKVIRALVTTQRALGFNLRARLPFVCARCIILRARLKLSAPEVKYPGPNKKYVAPLYINAGNKKFLETDYPRCRAIEVFRQFHFGLGTKNRNFVFYLTQNCRKWQF